MPCAPCMKCMGHNAKVELTSQSQVDKRSVGLSVSNRMRLIPLNHIEGLSERLRSQLEYSYLIRRIVITYIRHGPPGLGMAVSLPDIDSTLEYFDFRLTLQQSVTKRRSSFSEFILRSYSLCSTAASISTTLPSPSSHPTQSSVSTSTLGPSSKPKTLRIRPQPMLPPSSNLHASLTTTQRSVNTIALSSSSYASPSTTAKATLDWIDTSGKGQIKSTLSSCVRITASARLTRVAHAGTPPTKMLPNLGQSDHVIAHDHQLCVPCRPHNT